MAISVFERLDSSVSTTHPRRICCPQRSASYHRRNGCFRQMIGCCPLTSESCRRKTGCCPPTNGPLLPNNGRSSCQPSSASGRSIPAGTKTPMATLWGDCRARNWTQARSPVVSCQPSRSLFAAPPEAAILPKSERRLIQTMSRRCCHTWSAGRRWAGQPSMSSTNGTGTLLPTRVVGPPCCGSKPQPRPNAG